MSKIPERNLDPPKDDWMECPDCEGTGWYGCLPGGDISCPRCGGDGVISRAEERREIEAAQADKAYDAKRDREMMEEEEGK